MVDEEIISPGIKVSPMPERRRYFFLVWLLAGVMSLLLTRSFYLQVIEGHNFSLQAEENRVAVTLQPAPRGIIYDARGEKLLQNVASTDVMLDPHGLPNEENESQLLQEIPKYLSIDPVELRGKLSEARQRQDLVLLERALTHEDKIEIESALTNLPGISLVSSSVRSYLKPNVTAHILGYTGAASDVEVAARRTLLPTDITGKGGLEKTYDEKLRGRHGAQYHEVDVWGRPQKNLGEKSPESGQDLHISVDARLQEHIYDLFSERQRQREEADPGAAPVAGGAVVMEARTGRIKALISYPSFDPNAFSQPAMRERAQDILSDPLQPLFNRVVSGTYPPGSTIKPLIAAAALQEKIVTPETTWLSTGGIRIGQWFFPDWKAGGHGSTNVVKALAESVNTFFYLLAGGDDSQSGLGVNRLHEYLSAFSWGQATGIDLPGEETGLLPTPEWKRATKGEAWYIGDTYHFGIGQGDVLVTPLQVAVATAAIANGGVVLEPRLSDEGAREDLSVAEANLAIVRAGMRAAVTDGSARSMSQLPVAVAAKTGTAQIGGSEDTHAWLTSFGPIDDPEIVVTVLLEKGGEGDKDAAPMARDIWQWWADNR